MPLLLSFADNVVAVGAGVVVVAVVVAGVAG